MWSAALPRRFHGRLHFVQTFLIVVASPLTATISAQQKPQSPARAKSPEISATPHETRTPPVPRQNTYSPPPRKTTPPRTQSSPCRLCVKNCWISSPPPQKFPKPQIRPK